MSDGTRSLVKTFAPQVLLLLTGCTRITPKPVAAVAPLTPICRVDPAAVLPGEPVIVTATGIGFNPHVYYVWIGQGVTGTRETATVDTKSLAAGNYTVQAIVKEYKSGQDDQEVWRTATCSVTFTVR